MEQKIKETAQFSESKFAAFYTAIKQQAGKDFSSLIIYLSILRTYLIIKGREHIAPYNMPVFKRFLLWLFEIFLTVYEYIISLRFKCRFIIVNLFYKKNKGVIVIVEPTHLQQVLGMQKYMDKYNPVYITDKRKYIGLIQKSLNTSNILFVSKVYNNPSKTNNYLPNSLLLKYDLATSAFIQKNLENTLEQTKNQYNYIKKLVALIVKYSKVQFSLTYNDLSLTGRIITELFNQNKISTLYCMHGLLSDELIETFHNCNKYLIFGDYTRPILQKKGIEDKDIFTIGAPYLEYTLNQKELAGIASLREKYSTKKIALVLLSGRGHTTSKEHHEAIIALLEKTIQQTSNDYHFIFKLHRKDQVAYYNRILSNPNTANHISIFPYNYFNGIDSIFDWIKISNVVITGASTSALESMYLNKPVITIDLMQEYEHETIYITNGSTHHCRSEEEVINQLTQLNKANFTLKEQSLATKEAYFSSTQVMDSFFNKTFDKLITPTS